ncbi:thioesterase II family protein [Micromonospora sp. NPDC049282]|uniref:thioesterase II family protein n=1 Tax=Micromonospora sp. NPDC049282 TaxID=3364269 RepID=UPI003724C0DD
MTDDDAGLWIREYHPATPGSVQLVCLPHAGGSASYYFPVSRALAPEVEVLAIQYPGRQDRRHEPLVRDLPELARRVRAVLRPRTDRPLALFGHSMGASLAFEVARLLEQEDGVTPAWVFASGRRAPSRVRDERVHQLDDRGLIADVRRLSGTEGGLLGDDEVLRMILPAIRADYTAAETYRYADGPPLSAPITAFTGESDPKATVDEVRSWQDHTTGPFDLHTYSGGHFFLNRHQAAVLTIIRTQLACVRAGSRTA